MKKYLILILLTIVLYFIGIYKAKWDYYKNINNNVSFVSQTLQQRKIITTKSLEKLFNLLHNRMADFVYGIVLTKKNTPLLIGNIADKQIRNKVVSNKHINFILKDLKQNPQKYYNSKNRVVVKLDSKNFVFFRFIQLTDFNIVFVFLNTSFLQRKADLLLALGFFGFFFIILFIIFRKRKTKHTKKKNAIKTAPYIPKHNIQVAYEEKRNLQREIDKLSFFREITLATNSITDFEEMLKSIVKVLSLKFEQSNIILFVGEEEQNFEEFYPKFGWFYSSQKLLSEKELLYAGITACDIQIFDIQEKGKIIIPFKDNDKYLGFLLFELSPDFHEQFNLEDVSFISKQVAFAMKNAILYNQAITDGMTKLYLHRFFQIKLDEEIKRHTRYNRSLSMLLMDIDNFKKVNDTYGHQAGDYVLKTIASLIKEHIRKTDFAFRYGGEEMTVILPETELTNAFDIAEKIRHIIGNYDFQYQDLHLKITISIGVASFKSNESKESFIQRTDDAMYQAKTTGKNKVVVSE